MIEENEYAGRSAESAVGEGSRRDFLCKASCAVVAALIASGIPAQDALSFPVNVTSADATKDNELSYPLPSADGASIDQENQVILARFQNRVYAFSLSCPHQNTALRWLSQDQRFQCPRHQSKYRPDGTYMSGRATRNIDRFGLHLEGQKIAVDLNHLYRSDQQKAEWDTAVLVL